MPSPTKTFFLTVSLSVSSMGLIIFRIPQGVWQKFFGGSIWTQDYFLGLLRREGYLSAVRETLFYSGILHEETRNVGTVWFLLG